MELLAVAVVVFLLDIPFGYWRANTGKFSLQWFLSIHVPVPFVIALRFMAHIPFELYTYPILIGAFFLGQLLGKYVRSYLSPRLHIPATSCLVMALARGIRS